MSPRSEFLLLLKSAWPELSEATQERVGIFYEQVLAENEVQNLTRLVSPMDFLEGHVLDLRELLNSGFLEFPAMDLGSGAGVPGLLAALIRPDSWLLVESEQSKADFLKRAVQAMEIPDVQVFGERGEAVLKREKVGSVVVRAVGPVGRVYGWIRGCSTWNSLVLMKGPMWEKEWEGFQRDKKLSRGLELSKQHAYSVGVENKSRVLVKLVPRRIAVGQQ